MNKDMLVKLKQQLLQGLENISNSSYQLKSTNFDAYLNVHILLAIKLNYTLIEDSNTLLKSFPHQIEKPNIVNVTNGLSQLGFTAKKTKGCKNLEKINFPCVIMQGTDIQPGRIKVLFRENDTVICYDPFENSYTAYDKMTIDRSYQVYTFEPFDDERFDLGKGVLKFLGRSWFVALLSRFKVVIGKLILISIALHLFSLVLPLYIIYTYNRVVMSHDTSNLTVVTVSVVFLLICEQILRYFRASVLSWLGSRVDYIVTNEVLNKLNNLPLAIIEKLSLPSQIARIRSFSSLRDFFTGPIFSTLLELPAIILMILLISYIHYLFTIIFAAGFIMLAICLVIFHKIMSGQIKKATMLNTEKYYVTSIYLDKLNILHYQGLEKYYLRKLNYLSTQAAYYDLRSEFSSSFVDNYGKVVTNLGILITLCTGIFLIWHNEISIDALLATIFLSWRIFSPIQVASSTMVRSEKLYRTIKQIDNFLSLDDEDDNKKTISKTITLTGNIKLANIGVYYSSNKNFVLRNFTLLIKPGQLFAITGESGSGKSTVLKLISRYAKPNIGKILIDNYDISHLNLHSLRNQICYIHQSDNIIQGTVYENIQIVNPFISKAEIDDIFKMLGLADEFIKLPEGLNTQINSENIHTMSKNILKYISIAKLYATKSAILLIDGLNKESFSPQAWRTFLNDLQSWRGSRTMIIVTDDKLICDIADHVINLKKIT